MVFIMTLIRPRLDNLNNKKPMLSLDVQQLRQLINIIITAPLILLPVRPDQHDVNVQTGHGVRQHRRSWINPFSCALLILSASMWREKSNNWLFSLQPYQEADCFLICTSWVCRVPRRKRMSAIECRRRAAGSNYHPVWLAYLDLLQPRTSPSSVLMLPYVETCCSRRKEEGQRDLKGKKLKNRSGGVTGAKTVRLHRGAQSAKRIRMKEHPRNGYSVALISNYFQTGSVGKGIIFHLCSPFFLNTFP